MEVIAQMDLEKIPEPQIVELNEARAQVFSPAGAIILGISIIITLIFIFSLFFPVLESMQIAVVVFLALISWGYLLNSFTEHLKLTRDTLEFSAVMSRHQAIQLNEVIGFKLSDLGLNMSGDRYAFEISVAGKTKPVIISLGPCWNKAELTAFIKTFGQKLEKLD